MWLTSLCSSGQHTLFIYLFISMCCFVIGLLSHRNKQKCVWDRRMTFFLRSCYSCSNQLREICDVFLIYPFPNPQHDVGKVPQYCGPYRDDSIMLLLQICQQYICNTNLSFHYIERFYIGSIRSCDWGSNLSKLNLLLSCSIRGYIVDTFLFLFK